jgi:hypothetical protein
MGHGGHVRVTDLLGVLGVLLVPACGRTERHAHGFVSNDVAPSSASAGEGGASNVASASAGAPQQPEPNAVAGAENALDPRGSGGAEGGAGGAPPWVCIAASRFATRVIDHAFGGGQGFNQDRFPEPILGAPEANQPSSVVSLGNGGFVVLAFNDNAVVDGPGPDFTVFENPLPGFHELATVAISDDAEQWFEFPCTATNSGPDYGDCAGVAPVYSSSSNGVDPLDPAVSGGDHYDLAELGVTRARFVRITDRADLVGGTADVFDLDAVAIINAACP